ncbi:hypothetical protein LAZ67_23000752 [Cordylochernes scorpioides]|uniref:Retroviral polymerase SH3-like domain-containing protein n=1 Tax=Cordylochernes scorpioides TaxID=51811 RepID=A0ABY6LQA7_9ARAC|nr:hypothetical protein LAZ67_23000752 [Cordylochernes scorpioides]
MNNSIIQYSDSPRYLGVTLDPALTFKKHIDTMISKAKNRLKILKKISSLNWGANANILRTTYLALVRPILEYATPAWINASKTNLSKIDRIQASAGKIISRLRGSCPTRIAELESNLLPLQLRKKICFSKFITKKINSPKEHLTGKFIRNWLPAHVGIPGNKLADSLARAGALGLPEARESTTQLDERDLLRTIKTQCLQEWESNAAHDWYRAGGTSTCSVLPREQQPFISRLKSGHLQTMNFQNGCRVFPLCTKCNSQPATPRHIIDCIDSSIDERYSSPADTIKSLKLYKLDTLDLIFVDSNSTARQSSFKLATVSVNCDFEEGAIFLNDLEAKSFKCRGRRLDSSSAMQFGQDPRSPLMILAALAWILCILDRLVLLALIQAGVAYSKIGLTSARTMGHNCEVVVINEGAEDRALSVVEVTSPRLMLAVEVSKDEYIGVNNKDGHQIWMPNSNKVVTSRDVIFKETIPTFSLDIEKRNKEL